MMKEKMKILAIESSCDETAAAVIENNNGEIKIHSNIISSQIDIHKQFGGVFPEIASRAHAENIIPVIKESLINSIDDVDLIAVTDGPGLIGSLLVGVNVAKTLSFANNIPILPINHWLGHIYSCFTDDKNLPRFPLLALIVSGGHTGLVLMKSHTEYIQIGATLDDAAGEAFDKVAKLLELGYPGGPAISAAAEEYKKECHSGPDGNTGTGIQAWIPDVELPLGSRMTISFPRAMLNSKDYNLMSIKFPRAMMQSGNYNFSFSGLKTSVLNKVRTLTENWKLRTENFAPVVAYEFQQCVIDILIGKTLKAAEEFKPKSILLCGGVSANKELREQMKKAILSFRTPPVIPDRLATGSGIQEKTNDKINFFCPPIELTGDNAAMIGIAAAYQINAGVKPTTYNNVNANSNLKL